MSFPERVGYVSEESMTEFANSAGRTPGEEEPKPTPPPHSQPEPDIPEPDDETRDLVRPVQT